MKSFSLKNNRLRILVNQNGVSRKIMAVSFSARDLSFFVQFPYFQSKAYYFGQIDIPAGKIGINKFDLVKSSDFTTSRPVKFSYHQSGHVSLKDQKKGSRTTININAQPLSEIVADHLFTINVLGFDSYSSFKGNKIKKYSHIEYKIRAERKLIRFIGYGGSDLNAIVRMLGGEPDYVITINRPGQDVFHLCITDDNKTEANQDTGNFKNTIFAIVGFDSRNVPIDKSMKSLYMFAGNE